MNTSWVKTRQTKFTAYVTVYILIVLAVLGLANWLANRHNKSVDTTSNKRFSLSDQTAKIVKGLKQDVKIYYFDKSDQFSRAKDLLDRYDTLSGKLNVQYVDPYKQPQVARSMGVRTEGSTFVEVGQKREEAKSVTEEDVTGALIRALKGGQRNACIITGSGEHGIDDSGANGYSTFKEIVERDNYKMRTISLLEKAEIPKDCTVVIVAGPRFDYPAPVVAALKTSVESGGRVLFLLDPPFRFGKEPIADNQALIDLLSGWGVVPGKDLVLDTSGIGQMFGLRETAPLVTSYESHPITRDMRGVATAFMLPRSLEVKQGQKATAEKLFSTTEYSFSTDNLTSGAVDPKQGKKGPFTLGAAGTFATGKEGSQGRFVVVGSSNWVANSIVGFNGNRDLLLNMMNWLSSDEELISIRPKDPEDRRLALSRRQMNNIFVSSVILLPLAVVIAGVGVWWKRR